MKQRWNSMTFSIDVYWRLKRFNVTVTDAINVVY